MLNNEATRVFQWQNGQETQTVYWFSLDPYIKKVFASTTLAQLVSRLVLRPRGQTDAVNFSAEPGCMGYSFLRDETRGLLKRFDLR